MAWTTPKTFVPGVATSSEMNVHLRDNMNAVRTAQKITGSTDTTGASFGTTEVTITSFSYTFNSGTTYLLQGHVPYVQPSTAAAYTVDIRLKVGASVYGQAKILTAATTAFGDGAFVMGFAQGLSGAQTVALTIVATSGSGHSYGAGASFPAVLTLTPLDVV